MHCLTVTTSHAFKRPNIRIMNTGIKSLIERNKAQIEAAEILNEALEKARKVLTNVMDADDAEQAISDILEASEEV